MWRRGCRACVTRPLLTGDAVASGGRKWWGSGAARMGAMLRDQELNILEPEEREVHSILVWGQRYEPFV